MLPKLVLTAAAWILICAASAFAAEDFVHSFTGFVFPAKIAGFSRVKVTPLNDEPSGIEVEYDNTPFTVHLSVSVYPAGPASLQEHYQTTRDSLIKEHPKSALISEAPLVLKKSNVAYHGLNALLSFRGSIVGGKPHDLVSRQLLFRRGAYFVFYNIDYIAAEKDNATRQIDDFIDKLAWPPGGTDGPAGTD